MIEKQTVLDYQKTRLENIKKSLLTFKSDNAIKELENEIGSMENK